MPGDSNNINRYQYYQYPSPNGTNGKNTTCKGGQCFTGGCSGFGQQPSYTTYTNSGVFGNCSTCQGYGSMTSNGSKAKQTKSKNTDISKGGTGSTSGTSVFDIFEKRTDYTEHNVICEGGSCSGQSSSNVRVYGDGKYDSNIKTDGNGYLTGVTFRDNKDIKEFNSLSQFGDVIKTPDGRYYMPPTQAEIANLKQNGGSIRWKELTGDLLDKFKESAGIAVVDDGSSADSIAVAGNNRVDNPFARLATAKLDGSTLRKLEGGELSEEEIKELAEKCANDEGAQGTPEQWEALLKDIQGLHTGPLGDDKLANMKASFEKLLGEELGEFDPAAADGIMNRFGFESSAEMREQALDEEFGDNDEGLRDFNTLTKDYGLDANIFSNMWHKDFLPSNAEIANLQEFVQRYDSDDKKESQSDTIKNAVEKARKIIAEHQNETKE